MDGSQVFPLVGVVVGATLQFLLSRVSESGKAKSALRVQAYVDYVACVADLAHPPESQLRAEVLSRLAHATTRIAIYGSSNVVSALADFEKAGAEILTPDQHAVFLVIISAMRAEGVGTRGDVSVASLAAVVLGHAPATR
jgi:hypothetical protein